MVWRSSVLRAALIGAVLGVGWIMVYAILRKTIRTKEDIRNILNRNCIGVLPQVVFKKYRRKVNTDVILTNPLIGGDFLESVRLLRNSAATATTINTADITNITATDIRTNTAMAIHTKAATVTAANNKFR